MSDNPPPPTAVKPAAAAATTTTPTAGPRTPFKEQLEQFTFKAPKRQRRESVASGNNASGVANNSVSPSTHQSVDDFLNTLNYKTQPSTK